MNLFYYYMTIVMSHNQDHKHNIYKRLSSNVAFSERSGDVLTTTLKIYNSHAI